MSTDAFITGWALIGGVALIAFLVIVGRRK